LDFKYGNDVIHVVDSYKYLGIMFKNIGNFKLALLYITSQAEKSYASLVH